MTRRLFATTARRWGAAAALATAAASLAVGLAWRKAPGPGGGLAAGDAFVESLVARTRGAEGVRDVWFSDAVALGYIERLRLGLGSPFRLAEHALLDPRLDSLARRRTAWALIARTVRGEGYAVDPAALSGVSQPDSVEAVTSLLGARHLALIEAAVRSGRDPRAGELAVRLAYALAAAERTVERNAVAIVAPAAALVRDRWSAMSDARRLLRAARAGRADALALLPAWRRERRFAVERPASELGGEALEAEAMARVPGLLDSIRAIASVSTADTTHADVIGIAPRGSAPLLSRIVAERLAAGAARYAPPQAPIVTSVRHHAPSILAARAGHVSSATARDFVDRATNEELFTAEAARLAADEGAGKVARVAVAAAAALRAYAQESPWFPGDEAPSDVDLRRDFGVASVRFDQAIPSRWRPYYRRMLADGLADLRRVLPALTLGGAHVRFRSGPLGGATLAMHDPGSRTIHLPITTSAGALAHEVAHDLDWQMGRERFGRRGSYGTDVVVREQRGRLAASLRGLTSARLIAPAAADAARPPDDARPAEVFARTLDWFVSVALAREGRMNGYLSAVQDELLTGYVAVLPGDVTGWSARALADVLEETTLVGAPLREWLLAQWGPARLRRPYVLAREILASPVGRRGYGIARADAVPIVALCSAARPDAPVRSRAGLAQLAAEARARGALRARAQRLPESARPAWAQSVLGYGPWAPEVGESVVRRFAAAILSRFEESGAAGAALGWAEGRRPEGSAGDEAMPGWDSCA